MVEKAIEKKPNSIVAKAYRFAKQAHEGQRRKSGEPFFSHCLAVANQLCQWRLDPECVAAGLLHDIIEDTVVTKEDIKREFGDNILRLVDGVTKLGSVKYYGSEEQAENLRKLIIALNKDIRVIMVKLADRFHNMKTLKYLPRNKQKRIALETIEIYAPIAYRLGMHSVSGELEDLAFPYIYPREYKKLQKMIGSMYGERTRYLEKVKPVIEKELWESNIKENKITFRSKRLYSLYKKLKRYEMDMDKIYDLVAFRIIVPTISDCYATLGVIHKLWPPVPGRIKDYIAMPKPNGYRSLHTTVFCLDKKLTEFQVRTDDMDDEAENGVAAHWVYKREDKNKTYQQKSDEIIKEADWIRQLKELGNNEEGSEFMEKLKTDILYDRIFVLTPKGEIKDLPAGATAVDFAYHVHSKLGDETTGAKVNGHITPLSQELQSGDMVEILRQKNKKPSTDWLKFVKTSIAKERIRAHANKKKKRGGGF